MASSLVGISDNFYDFCQNIISKNCREQHCKYF